MTSRRRDDRQVHEAKAAAEVPASGRTSLASGVTRLLAGRVASLLLTFVAWAVIARSLSPGNFGFLQLGIAVVFYLAFMTDAGLTTLGTRELAASGKASLLIRRVHGARIAMGVSVLIIATAAAVLLSDGGERIAWIALISTVVASSVNAVWMLRALNRSAALAALDVLGAVLLLVGAVFLVRAGADIVLAASAYAVAQWSVAALSLWQLRDRVLIRPTLRGSLPLLRRAGPLGVAVLAINVYYSADSILLGLFRGEVEVGYYAAAYKLVLPWLLIASVVGLLAMPRLATDISQHLDVRPLLHRMARLLIALGLTVAVGGTILAPMLVSLVFGHVYDDAALPLAILIWSTVTVFANAPFGFLMLARRMDAAYMWIAVAGAVLNIGLNLVLIPRIGMVGAAAATLAAEVLVLASILWVTRDVSVRAVLPALGTGIVLAALTALVIWPIRHMPLAIAVGIAAFAVGAVLLRIVSVAEIRGVVMETLSGSRPA